MVKLSNKNWRHRRLFPCLIVFFIISVSQMVVSSPLYAMSQQKQLLVINSYNEGAPWVQDYITPFMLEAAKNKDLTCNLVHMNATLVRTDSLYSMVVDGIFDRFRDDKPDFLVLVGNMAFSIKDRIKSEWGDIPMLYFGTSDRIIPEGKYLSGDKTILNRETVPLANLRERYNFTFIEVPECYKETIDMMNRMQPGMKKLVFASDDLSGNIELDKHIRDYIATAYPGLEYEWLVASQETRTEVQKYLTDADPSVGFLLSSWFYSRQSALGYPMLMAGDMRLHPRVPYSH